MGKLFPVLLFTHLSFSVTAKSWEAEKDNHIVPLNYIGAFQNGLHNNLVQYRKFIIAYQAHFIHKELLQAKLLLKCIAYIRCKLPIEQMGIK